MTVIYTESKIEAAQLDTQSKLERIQLNIEALCSHYHSASRESSISCCFADWSSN